MQMSDETIGVIICLTVGIIILIVWIRSRKVGPAESLACSRCGELGPNKLQNDGVSRLPGYLCPKCGLRMRPPASTFRYAALLVLSLAMATSLALVMGVKSVVCEGFEIFSTTLAVAGYSIWQLLRPTPHVSSGSGGNHWRGNQEPL